VAGDPDDNARREARKVGLDGGARPRPPDPPPPPADATAEEILAYYGGNEAAMRRELERRGREAQRRLLAESMAAADPAQQPGVETAEDMRLSPTRSTASIEYVDGRAGRWAYPTASFWLVLDQRVKRGKLATIHGLSEQTRRSRELEFVGRTRVGELVAWVDENLEQARRASRLHEIPTGFRATREGVLPPWHVKPAAHRGSR
jgi:hypothetical protein